MLYSQHARQRRGPAQVPTRCKIPCACQRDRQACLNQGLTGKTNMTTHQTTCHTGLDTCVLTIYLISNQSINTNNTIVPESFRQRTQRVSPHGQRGRSPHASPWPHSLSRYHTPRTCSTCLSNASVRATMLMFATDRSIRDSDTLFDTVA